MRSTCWVDGGSGFWRDAGVALCGGRRLAGALSNGTVGGAADGARTSPRVAD